MLHSLGHSTFSVDDFIDICKTANIDVIIDTRSHPGSKNYPHFNKECMRAWLTEAGIEYQWWPYLGGWNNHHASLSDNTIKLFKERYDVDIEIYTNNAFPKQRIAKKRPLTDEFGWTNYGFHDYQHYMQLPEFMDSVSDLINLSKDGRNYAMICCEACWTRCHRSMIADYLNKLGHEVYHIIPRFRKIKLPRTVVKLTPHSQVINDRLKRYHKDIILAWDEHEESGCKS
jgi:uncharacterized protein (DUF488 family)